MCTSLEPTGGPPPSGASRHLSGGHADALRRLDGSHWFSSNLSRLHSHSFGLMVELPLLLPLRSLPLPGCRP